MSNGGDDDLVKCDEQVSESGCSNTSKAEWMLKWSAEFNERLRIKKESEAEKILIMEEEALKDLNNWAADYRRSFAKSVKASREHDREMKEKEQLANRTTFSSADATCKELWERVCDLCNLNESHDDSSYPDKLCPTDKDHLQRMRSVLLALKRVPPFLQS